MARLVPLARRVRLEPRLVVQVPRVKLDLLVLLVPLVRRLARLAQQVLQAVAVLQVVPALTDRKAILVLPA